MSDKDISIDNEYIKAGIKLSTYFDRIPRAQEAVANQVFEDTKQYMPFLSGNMLKEAAARNNFAQGVVCVGAGPYARYLYEGKVMVETNGRHAFYIEGVGWRHKAGSKLRATEKPLTYTKVGACSHWFDAASKANGEKWIERAKGIIYGEQ